MYQEKDFAKVFCVWRKKDSLCVSSLNKNRFHRVESILPISRYLTIRFDYYSNEENY